MTNEQEEKLKRIERENDWAMRLELVQIELDEIGKILDELKVKMDAAHNKFVKNA